ncbi:MAG: sterol desaturase family protein [Saprospiraceae bacterium]|nr:sterol desaturase family protein [Saprospiraceae bacterium]
MEFLRDLEAFQIERTGTFVLAGVILLVMILERKMPYTKEVNFFRKDFWMDLLWYTLIQSYLLKLFIFDLVILPFKNYMGWSGVGWISHWPIWFLVFLFLVTHDFYIYWFHRWQHHNKWLWKTHEAHHSVRDVDWLAGSRSHPLEIFINQTIEFAPIILLLDSKTAAIIVPAKAFLDAVWGIWIHSNIDLKLGKAIYVINGPEMHQWHHANHKEVFYANYATKFSFFDWLFGTAFLPEKRPVKWPILKPLGFGLPYRFPDTYLGQTIYSFYKVKIDKLNTLHFIHLLNNIKLRLPKRVHLKLRSWFNYIFSNNSFPYQLDDQKRKCPHCLSEINKYFDKNIQIHQCSKCGVVLEKKSEFVN